MRNQNMPKLPSINRRPWPRIRVATTSLLIWLATLHTLAFASSTHDLAIQVVSSRRDAVSGGDTLVEIAAPGRSHWRVLLDGRDVSDSFQLSARSGHLLALLHGLREGSSMLEVRVDGVLRSRLELLNHLITGPIFSGPHQQPFICQTAANSIGPPIDTDCSAKTVVAYYYKSTEPPIEVDPLQIKAAEQNAPPGSLSPGFKPYDPFAPPPGDVALTVTTDGHSVPYIVRREIGTINRAVYDIEFLHEPGQRLPSPWTTPTPGWNGRLVYIFGGGCGPGYRQGTLGPVGRPQEPLLSQGYAIATSTLNMFKNNCADRISAETLSMVKEHFIKQYGQPMHTIGWGDSGGAMQLHLIVQNYPGLLDGIIPIKSFPDVTTYVQYGGDCQLLDAAFDASVHNWTEAQKAAVSGFASWHYCAGYKLYRILYLDPRNCDPSVPKEVVYDRITNPQGVRCDVFGNEVNVFGRVPLTGLPRRAFDNVGVQYGLAAFNSGEIDAQQFIELNERAGGFDEDGNIIPTRTQADTETVRLAYQRGLVLTGGGGLSDVPIIDWRPYSDEIAVVDGHTRLFSFATRARLVKANGSAANQVIVVGSRESWFDWESDRPWSPRQLVRKMDDWLDRIASDTTAAPASEKVVRNKPNDLDDGCIGVDGEHITAHAHFQGTDRCDKMYPSYGNPRLAAGAPVADDVLKCVLKPVDPNDYGQHLNTDQLTRLRAVFPAGICDYSQPGIGQEITRKTWLHF